MSSIEANCLLCGASDVFRFLRLSENLDNFYSERRVPQAIDIKHPGCGGEMYAATNEVRLNRRVRERVYSLPGQKLANRL